MGHSCKLHTVTKLMPCRFTYLFKTMAGIQRSDATMESLCHSLRVCFHWKKAKDNLIKRAKTLKLKTRNVNFLNGILSSAAISAAVSSKLTGNRTITE